MSAQSLHRSLLREQVARARRESADVLEQWKDATLADRGAAGCRFNREVQRIIDKLRADAARIAPPPGWDAQ